MTWRIVRSRLRSRFGLRVFGERVSTDVGAITRLVKKSVVRGTLLSISNLYATVRPAVALRTVVFAMRFFLPFCLAALSLTSTASGAFVMAVNVDEQTLKQLPIVTGAGEPIMSGGTVAIGTFTSGDPESLIAGLGSPGGLTALLGDFITFGSTHPVGFNFPGLYLVDITQAIELYSPFVGQSIYTFIGDGPTLVGSVEFAIVRHPVFFEADAPLFSAKIDISDPAVTILLGRADGPSVTTALGPSLTSLRLGSNMTVPEPASAILLLVGGGLGLRRRRG